MPNPDEKTYALFSNPINRKIVTALEEKGTKVFQFPPLSTEKTLLDAKSIACIKNLNYIDWVIFPDVLTVDYFLQILEENEIDLFEMDSVQVCAFGEMVADRLRFVQLHADIIPASTEATQIFLALSEYIEKDGMNKLNFLLPKETLLEYVIEEKLTEIGANVITMPVYQAKKLRTDEITKLKILLENGAIDEFVFSSATDLIALKIYFGENEISALLSEINVSTFDKTMLQILKEHDLKPQYLQLQ